MRGRLIVFDNETFGPDRPIEISIDIQNKCFSVGPLGASYDSAFSSPLIDEECTIRWISTQYGNDVLLVEYMNEKSYLFYSVYSLRNFYKYSVKYLKLSRTKRATLYH